MQNSALFALSERHPLKLWYLIATGLIELEQDKRIEYDASEKFLLGIILNISY